MSAGLVGWTRPDRCGVVKRFSVHMDIACSVHVAPVLPSLGVAPPITVLRALCQAARAVTPEGLLSPSGVASRSATVSKARHLVGSDSAAFHSSLPIIVFLRESAM